MATGLKNRIHKKFLFSAGPIVPLPQECLPSERTQTAETLSRWMLKTTAKWKQRTTPSPEDFSPAKRHTHTLQFQPVASQNKRCDKPVKIELLTEDRTFEYNRTGSRNHALRGS
ncbi:uncharacterized protein LOC122693665 isoform X2 [Cervus elaphus]|uniref:uncharacterized protein LOC122449730 isoform X2 n=1 Tax=Cervus canadensis TaxID=1574408 RepID=UPI001C9E8E17|nr:uncharacterized protein LOC122449730 isoform X2 [Cervus canadensis]XP_043757290.1 uncharacterized protein LOC122693665 isoform X2 [Cervus elaphus]